MARPGVLTPGHRQVLENMWAQGACLAAIARAMGVDPGTVTRELDRNGAHHRGARNPRMHDHPPGHRLRKRYAVGYNAAWAQARADRRRRRPRRPCLARGGLLRTIVLARLAEEWSPAQIAAWLKRVFPGCEELHVSHETIYQAIYVQSRGGLRAELKKLYPREPLRTGRASRSAQSRGARAEGGGRGNKSWTAGLHISQRPAGADDRAVPGHWEGDLVIGAGGSSAIATLVERSTRYAVLCSLPEGRDAGAVAAALSQAAGRVPEHLRSSLLRSLAWDQGSEMARHAEFTVATGCEVFFCDPHSPWQRGSNENTNGLLRQYFPKGSFDFDTIDQAGLDEVAFRLNTRPRQTLGWDTPAQRLAELIAPDPEFGV